MIDATCQRGGTKHRSDDADLRLTSLASGLRRLAAIAIAVLFTVSDGLAQKARVSAARDRFLAAAPGSEAAFAAMLDEAFALLSMDLEQVIEVAKTCQRQAEEFDAHGPMSAALALEALATLKREGQLNARELLELSAAKAIEGELAPSMSARIEIARALFHFSVDEYSECRRSLERALELAQQSELHIVRARALALRGMMMRNRDPAIGLQDLRGALASAGDACGRIWVFGAQVHEHEYRNRPEAAARIADAAVAHALVCGDRAEAAHMYRHVVSACLGRGAIEDARVAAEKGVEQAKLLGDREELCTCMRTLARVHMIADDWEAARDAITGAVHAISGLGMPIEENATHEMALDIALQLDDQAGIKNHAARMSELNRFLSSAGVQHDRHESMRAIDREKDDRLREQLNGQAREAELVTRARLYQIVALAVGLVLMAAIAALAYRSTRRQEKLNRRLLDEMDTSRKAESARSALEQKIRRMERLDSLGLLAGGFAHDFNNLLVGVLGNTELLAESQGLTSSDHYSVEQIRTSASRAAELCQEILAYAGRAPIDRQATELNSLVSGIVPLVRTGTGAGVTVQVIEGDDQIFVDADQPQIEQVLLNLTTNAADAMAGSGQLQIRLGSCLLDAETLERGHWFGTLDAAGWYAYFEVQDSGSGMESATIERVFDPFFSTRFPGRGLGLAASYGIVRRHGGVIRVESEVGEWTRFSVFLPLLEDFSNVSAPAAVTVRDSAPAATEGVSIPQVAPPDDRRVVLIVDDEPHVREIARRAVEAPDVVVMEADSGQAAIDIAAEHADELRCVLLDLTMPGMDGVEVLESLRKHSEDLSVVMMSGHAEESVRNRISAGHVEFLAKPFTLQAVRDAVR